MFYFCFADRRKSASGRKLEKEFSKGSLDRRRLLSNEKVISPSSSSCSESENDTEIEVVLKQSRNRLEETEALKNRHHLLRSEDFVSKISYGIVLDFLSWSIFSQPIQTLTPINHSFFYNSQIPGRNHCHLQRKCTLFGDILGWSGRCRTVTSSSPGDSR